MKKKLLSFVLAALMVVGCFGTFAVGAAAMDCVKIDIEATQRTDGLYEVAFKIAENPGFAGFKLKFTFDNTKATIVDYLKDEYDEVLTELPGTITSNVAEPGVNLAKLTSVTAVFAQPRDFKRTATVLTVIFDVKEDFTFTYDSSSNFSKSDTKVDMTGSFESADTGKVTLPELTGLSFTDAEFNYDGKAHAIEVKNVPEGATVVYSGGSNSFTNAGVYTITATVAKSGYSTWTSTAKLTIKAKELTVNGLTANEKTYNANTDVTLSGGTLVGVISGDDVTATMPTSGTAASANKGVQNVTFAPITLSGEKRGNYTLKQPTVTVKINPYTVNVTANNVSKKLGTDDPALTYNYNDAFVDANGGFTGSLVRENGNTVGTYKIKRGTLAAVDANININFTEGTFTINEKEAQNVTVDVSTITFTYGDADVTINASKTAGSSAGFTFSSSNENVATVDASGKVTPVGVGSAVITVRSAGDTNYSDFEAKVNVTVNAKKVTVTPNASQTFTYGDNINVAYVLSDDIDVVGALAVDGKNVGTRNVLIGTLAPASANYTLELAAATVEISKKTVNVTGKVVYYPHLAAETAVINMAETKNSISVNAADIVSGDSVNVIFTGLTVNAGVVEGLTIDNANYDPTFNVTVELNELTEEEFIEIIEDAVEEIVNNAGSFTANTGIGSAINNLKNEILDKLKDAINGDLEIKFEENDKVNEDGSLKDGVEVGDDVTFVPVLYRNGVRVNANLGSYTAVVPANGNNNIQSLLYFYYLMSQKNKKPVSAVTSSVASGKVVSGTKVVLSTETAGATIYYTTDGSKPTSLSKEYTGAITLPTGETTITAIAVKSGMTTSTPVSFTYTVSDVVGTQITLKDGASDIKFMEGRGEKFEAESDATRNEVVKALAEIFNIVTDGKASDLSDVAAENKELVELFTAAGIINGYSDGTFRGDKTITRAEFCKIVCVMLNINVDNVKDAGFKDTDHWAKAYIDACAAEGLVTGKSADRFDPNGNIKRGELATLICRITGAEEGNACKYADVSSDAWYFGYVSAAAK